MRQQPGADRLSLALQRWDCRVAGAELRGGMSVVVPVRTSDGSPLMIKLLDPDAAAREAIALRVFPPSACVRCFDHDADLGALLLERLTDESLAGAEADELIIVQAGLAHRLAVPDPGGIERLSDAGLLEHLEDLRRQSPGLLANRVVDAARETLRDLGQETVTTLTHGDLHSINVHKDVGGNWRALDPNPRVATIAFESHTVIVERPRLNEVIEAGSSELRRRLDLFADVAEVSFDWSERLCQARAVLSALYEHSRGSLELSNGLRWMSEVLTPQARS